MCVCLLSPKKNHGEFKWSFTVFKLEIPCAPNEIWRLFTEKKSSIYIEASYFSSPQIAEGQRYRGTWSRRSKIHMIRQWNS